MKGLSDGLATVDGDVLLDDFIEEFVHGGPVIGRGLVIFDEGLPLLDVVVERGATEAASERFFLVDIDVVGEAVSPSAENVAIADCDGFGDVVGDDLGSDFTVAMLPLDETASFQIDGVERTFAGMGDDDVADDVVDFALRQKLDEAVAGIEVITLERLPGIVFRVDEAIVGIERELPGIGKLTMRVEVDLSRCGNPETVGGPDDINNVSDRLGALAVWEVGIAVSVSDAIETETVVVTEVLECKTLILLKAVAVTPPGLLGAVGIGVLVEVIAAVERVVVGIF